MNQLIVLSAIVLLPLIPAFILFKTIKSSAQVDGPLAGGLKVSLGGAFGGYVALTVFIATYFSHMPHVTTWHVKGELQFPGATPSVITCEVHPPEFTIYGENQFNLDLPIDEDGALPSIVIAANGFQTKTIDLADPDGKIGGRYQAKKYSAASIIQVNKPIVFQKKGPDYQPVKQVAEGAIQ
jgi:hypothetical protein